MDITNKQKERGARRSNETLSKIAKKHFAKIIVKINI
jgi:hypothetical protein